MLDTILANISANTINYIQPAERIATNLVIHRLHDYTAFFETVQHKYSIAGVRLEAVYKYDDLTLILDNEGNKRCYLEYYNYIHDDNVKGLRYVKKLEIDQSYTKFKPSQEYDNIQYVLHIEFETKIGVIDVEYILAVPPTGRLLDIDPMQIFNNPDTVYVSVSYKYYITQNVKGAPHELHDFISTFSQEKVKSKK